RYTVGVWVGRPDGTPLPGQYGAVTALPLLFDVMDALPRAAGDAARPPAPPSVSQVEVCWPLGIRRDAQPAAACQRSLEAWLLDAAAPPTFAERDTRSWSSGLQRIDVDAGSGLRVSADCAGPHALASVQVARWPALAAPWLTAEEQQASRLPPLAPDCRDDGRDAAEPLRIAGLNDGATLAAPPGRDGGVRLALRALGTSARVQWLLDGRRIGESVGASTLVHVFTGSGPRTLTALADNGSWASVAFTLAR
ncbi:MAG TPA: penicillin-binding protein 1C, partial [Luteimonas sp.]|nr:penicillin-binding protein 1C [Luteimonas sp.]